MIFANNVLHNKQIFEFESPSTPRDFRDLIKARPATTFKNMRQPKLNQNLCRG